MVIKLKNCGVFQNIKQSYMKNFREKEVKDLSTVVGGATGIESTTDIKGFFDGIKGNASIWVDVRITKINL